MHYLYITYTLHLCITYHVFKIQDLVLCNYGLTDVLYIYMYVSKILLTQSQILRTFAHM
jgi:hypothetical protein